MKAVVLEDYAIQQGDLDWSGVEALVPDVTRYGRTAPEEVVPEYLAEVMPTTSPYILNKGPPELPELMAAAV